MNTQTEMTAAQMIDITRMRTIYSHLQTNGDIDTILQVADNNEPLLAEIGQAMIDGDTVSLEGYFKSGDIKILHGEPVPETNAVYCLYLPPYYIFTDLKKVYE